MTGLASALAAPQAPSNLSATVVGSTVTLTWIPAASGDPPTSYVVEAGSSAGLTNLVQVDTGSSAISLTATAVPAATYFIRVRSRNASGTSGASNEVVVSVGSTGCARAPGPPTGLASSVSAADVTLTWQGPVSGCAATSYTIETGSSTGLSNLVVFSTGSVATRFLAGGVSNGIYFVRVRAVNAIGASAASNEIVVTVGSVTPASPLPYGQVTGGGPVPCPPGPPSAAVTCNSLVVVCPSAPSATATLRITRPSSTALNRGTIVLTTGGAGTIFDNSTLTLAMIATFVGDGLVVVQMAWDPPGIWGGPPARTFACRAATAAKWIYENVHTGSRSKLFAAQGTSGGAAQIAFGIADYGVSDFLDLANLGGGPPNCPLCECGQPTPVEPLLSAGVTCPASFRDPLLNYPATVVRFFLGDQDPNHDGTVDTARAYYGAITSSKSFTTVPNTPHIVETTQAGVDAYVGAVRAALK